jgi:hypothetical protein
MHLQKYHQISELLMFYPTSFDALDRQMKNTVISIITNRYVEFIRLAKTYDLSLVGLVEKAHNTTGRFPFYLLNEEIKDLFVDKVM